VTIADVRLASAPCCSPSNPSFSPSPVVFPTQAFLRTVRVLRGLALLLYDQGKSDVAPRFVPRDSAGYLRITCPKCLRPNKLEAMSLNGGLHQTTCQTCGLPVRFEINHEIEPPMERNDA